MGLSANQARLLSITSRLTDNELRSQTITNAKMALATQSSNASAEYMNALSSTDLMFTTYDTSGNKVLQSLTGATLSNYAPLKNQYIMMNKNNKALVSELDAKNYENSANLEEFLDKYGLIDGYINNLAEYDDLVSDWKSKEPQKENYTKTVSVENNELYNLVTNSGGCLGYTIDGIPEHNNCYMHVLSDLIGQGTHTTSSGNEYIIETDIDWNWYSAKHQSNTWNGHTWNEVHELIKTAKCSGQVLTEDEKTKEVQYGSSKKTVTLGGRVSDPTMSIYQRAVDLLWDVHNDYDGSVFGGQAKDDHLEQFFYFIEYDLKQAIKENVFDEEAYNNAYNEWLSKEPTKPDLKVDDKDKAQWYANLWYIMNSSETSNLVYEKNADDDNYLAIENLVNYNKDLSNNGNNYVILEDGLYNNADWLQSALNSGMVTLKQAIFTTPCEDEERALEVISKGVTLQSIIWTNASDIVSQESEAKITKAEVEYKQKVADIEAKDKQFDNVLKRLDTEHSALQTEYDSIKTVVDKTIERNLKLYS